MLGIYPLFFRVWMKENKYLPTMLDIPIDTFKWILFLLLSAALIIHLCPRSEFSVILWLYMIKSEKWEYEVSVGLSLAYSRIIWSIVNSKIHFVHVHHFNQKVLDYGYYYILDAAARTKNYSGAELEGVVKSAVSYALNRQLSMDDLTKQVEEENIKITMDDFLNALHEVIPAFGASTDDLERGRYD